MGVAPGVAAGAAAGGDGAHPSAGRASRCRVCGRPRAHHDRSRGGQRLGPRSRSARPRSPPRPIGGSRPPGGAHPSGHGSAACCRARSGRSEILVGPDVDPGAGLEHEAALPQRRGAKAEVDVLKPVAEEGVEAAQLGEVGGAHGHRLRGDRVEAEVGDLRGVLRRMSLQVRTRRRVADREHQPGRADRVVGVEEQGLGAEDPGLGEPPGQRLPPAGPHRGPGGEEYDVLTGAAREPEVPADRDPQVAGEPLVPHPALGEELRSQARDRPTPLSRCRRRPPRGRRPGCARAPSAPPAWSALRRRGWARSPTAAPAPGRPRRPRPRPSRPTAGRVRRTGSVRDSLVVIRPVAGERGVVVDSRRTAAAAARLRRPSRSAKSWSTQRRSSSSKPPTSRARSRSTTRTFGSTKLCTRRSS